MQTSLRTCLALGLCVGWASSALAAQLIDWDGEGAQREIVDLSDPVRIARLNFNRVQSCTVGTNDPVNGEFCTDVVLMPTESIQLGVYGTALDAGVAACAESGQASDVALGTVRPQGAIAPDRYAVVLDECQDGEYGPEDWVFEPALDVIPPWPQEGRLPAHDAAGRVKGPIAAPAVTWSYVKDSGVGTMTCCARSSPVLSADNVLYVGNNGGQLWAFRADNGLPLWAFPTTPANFISSPVLGIDGTVYFGSRNGTAYAITPAADQLSASLLWSRPLGAPGVDGAVFGGPVLNEGSQVVYFGTAGGRIHALDATSGAPVASSYDSDDQIFETPALGRDGTLYVGTMGGRLLALNPDLTENWTRTLLEDYETTQTCPGLPEPAFVSSPTWSEQGSGSGTVYVGLSLLCGPHSHFFALDAASGSTLWVYPAHPDVSAFGFDGGAAVAPDGTIYAGGGLIQGEAPFRYLFGFSPGGAIVEQVSLLGTLREGPILGRDGTIYAVTENAPSVVAVRSGAVLWTHAPGDDARPRPALGMDNTLYFASDDGKIVALGGSPVVHVRALEVAQAVQNWRNEIPLTTNKRTWVRAHLESAGDTQLVRGCLRGFVGGTELPESPLTAENAGGTLVVIADQVAADWRDDLDSTLNFRLPRNWTQTGTVELRLERQALEKSCLELRTAPAPEDPEFACAEPEEPGLGSEPHDCRVNASFAVVPSPLVHYIPIDWTDVLSISHVLPDADLVSVIRRVHASLPTPDLPPAVRIDAHYAWGQANPEPSDSSVLRALKLKRCYDGCCFFCDEYYHGIVPDRPVSGTSGLGEMPGSVAVSGFEGNPGPGWYTPPHEAGHNLGLWHTHSRLLDLNQNGVLDHTESLYVQQVCDQYDGIGAALFTQSPPDFPFVYEMDDVRVPRVPTRPGWDPLWTALLGPVYASDDRLFAGIDAYPTMSANPPPVDVLDPLRTNEVMSYCHVRPDPRPMGFSSAYYTALRDALLAAGGGAPASGDTLLVAGSVDPLLGGGALARVGRIAQAAAATTGPYTVDVLDAGGATLASVGFTPSEPSDSADSEATFIVGVPYEAAARQVVLRQGPAVLSTRVASASPPTVTVISPNGGETLTGPTATLTWAGSDPDGPSPTYVVQYSPDAGASWETLAVDLQQTSLTVARTNLRGSAQGLIRVRAEDGFHSAEDVSNAVFTVANSAPVVVIAAPNEDQLFVGDQRIAFEAHGLDREDGTLPIANYVWTSNLDGSLGSGQDLARVASTLSEGLHTISVTASDAAGGQAQASVDVQVLRALPDQDQDGFPDVYDNCPTFQNPTQADDDRDGIGDACDDVTAVANLAISKSDSPDPVSPGAPVDYSLAVTNLGPDTAPNVEIVDQAPAGFGIFGVLISGAFTQANCSYTNTTFTCDMGSLASGAGGTLTLQFQASPTPGVVTNTASVSSDAADPIVTNNSDGETTTVSVDSDADGVGDIADNCPTVANATQTDTDLDGVGQACDVCTALANQRVTTTPPAWMTLVSGQRDTDADGFGDRCDFDHDQAGLVITSTDFNHLKASVSKLVSASTCGTTGNLRCGKFDHDEAGAVITSSDFNLIKAAVGKTNGPNCGAACARPFNAPGKVTCAGPAC